jgi:hypothetical protein
MGIAIWNIGRCCYIELFYILREGEGGRFLGFRVVEWFRVRD